ncbi:DUF4352 domain-containing protein [Streptomyces desertarenae]|uniref:DUF4352 domain-containing protein n=1 Tax=Streptomyces desertarenae TaxID=2666184 RepID=A0ABW4PRU6_9ACTN
MTQHNPGPRQWGPGTPQQPAPPPGRSGAGKAIGFGCLGVVVLFVVIGAVAAALGGGGDQGAGSRPAASSVPEGSGAEGAGRERPREEPGGQAAAEPPIRVTAQATGFRPTVLARGQHTSVLVTVVNNGAEKVAVNPLYFEVTGSDGTKYDVELAADERQIDTVELARGEKATGTVTVRGAVEPASVAFTNGPFGETVTAGVAR